MNNQNVADETELYQELKGQEVEVIAFYAYPFRPLEPYKKMFTFDGVENGELKLTKNSSGQTMTFPLNEIVIDVAQKTVRLTHGFLYFWLDPTTQIVPSPTSADEVILFGGQSHWQYLRYSQATTPPPAKDFV